MGTDPDPLLCDRQFEQETGKACRVYVQCMLPALVMHICRFNQTMMPECRSATKVDRLVACRMQICMGMEGTLRHLCPPLGQCCPPTW